VTANDGVSSTVRTFDLTVTPCVVASIVWETQPTGMAAGALFGTAPRVSLRKADNSLCTSNPAPVSLVVTTDTSEQQDATITGSASVIPSGGYALFSAARMERAGTGFTLGATQDGVMTLINSNTFNVTAGSASKLVFYQQPLTNDPSAAMIPAPSVRSADTYGNYVASSGISVTMSLQDNGEGATLSGTKTVSTNASGIASFTGLSLDKLGTYYLRATPANGWAAVDSDYFDIIVITPQNFTSIIEMLTSTIPGTNGNSTFERAGTTMGTNFMDGMNTCTWRFVAYNSGNNAATVYLKVGTTDIANVGVAKTVSTPTVFSTTFDCALFTPSGSWSLKTFKNAVVTSSQIIVKQVAAKRTQVYLPLLSVEEADADGAVTTTSTTPVVISDINFPTYDWDSTEWSNLNEVVFSITGKTSSGSFCGALFNKTTDTQVGGEICSTSTSEINVTQSIPRASMPATGELEARVRNTSGGTATIYKAGVYLRLVNIVKAKSIQRIAGAKAGLTAADNFVSQRAKSYLTDFGGTKTEKLECRAKGGASTSGAFVMKDANGNLSGTTSVGNVTGSTISFSTQSSFTSLENTIGPTTNARNYFMNFTRTSGSIDLSQCLYSTNVSY
jgi:hypothetical protein